MIGTHRLDCRLVYDFNTRVGEVYLEKGHKAEMRGWIDLFQAIDPVVQEIKTWSGGEQDAGWVYDRNQWIAAKPVHPNLRRDLQQEMG